MTISIDHFLRAVDEIEQNSWWAEAVGPKLKELEFAYNFENGTITPVPQEPLESLLLRVRRFTMNKSAEHLLSVHKALKQTATDSDRQLLDAWRKYWRLAFIKEPFHLERDGKREVTNAYKVYHSFINGHYFHTNDPALSVILYGSGAPQRVALPQSFFQNMFHCAVYNLGLAAIALHRYVNNGNTFANLPLNDGMNTVFGFVWWLDRADELDAQYKVFNEWIEQNGGCNEGRWA